MATKKKAKKKSKKSIAIAKRGETSLATAASFEAQSAAGFEEADDDAYSIPFLAMLQSGSPQCKRSEGAFIKGAEEGMVMNTVTQELIDMSEDAGVVIIPVHYRRVFGKWKPRDEGGGFLGEISPGDALIETAERDGGKLVLPDGNHLVDTRKHYVLLVNFEAKTFDAAIIAMTSTQIKKSRNIMTRLRNLKLRGENGGFFTPPMYANVLRLESTPENNDQGSWMGWKPVFEELRQLDLEDDFEAEIFQAAINFRDAIVGGQVKEQNIDVTSGDGGDSEEVGY